jgi:hypothetical protein
MCQSMLTDVDDSGLPDEAASSDPAVGLRGVKALRDLADRLEALHVGSARTLGWSWQQIGEALDVSRQAVHMKYAIRTRDPRT